MKRIFIYIYTYKPTWLVSFAAFIFIFFDLTPLFGDEAHCDEQIFQTGG